MLFCVIGDEDLAKALQQHHLVCSLPLRASDQMVLARIIQTSPHEQYDTQFVFVGDGPQVAGRASSFAGRESFRRDPVLVATGGSSDDGVLRVTPAATPTETVGALLKALGMEIELPHQAVVGGANVVPFPDRIKPSPSQARAPEIDPSPPDQEPADAAPAPPAEPPPVIPPAPAPPPVMESVMAPPAPVLEPVYEPVPPPVMAPPAPVAPPIVAPDTPPEYQQPPPPGPDPGYQQPPSPGPDPGYQQPPSPGPDPGYQQPPSPGPDPGYQQPPSPGPDPGYQQPPSPGPDPGYQQPPSPGPDPGYQQPPSPGPDPGYQQPPSPGPDPGYQQPPSPGPDPGYQQPPSPGPGGYQQPPSPVPGGYQQPPSPGPDGYQQPPSPGPDGYQQPPSPGPDPGYQQPPPPGPGPAEHSTAPEARYDPPPPPQSYEESTPEDQDAYYRATHRQEQHIPGRPPPAEDPNYAPNAAIARPRRGAPGRVIAVTAAKGGVGKSTLTLWLAEAMTDLGLSVCVFDANIAQPDLLGMTGQWKRERLGLAGLVKPTGLRFSQDELDSALLQVEGLGDILPGPPDPIEAVQAPALRAAAQAIEMLRGMYEWVIVDTPVASGFERTIRELVKPYADVILLVVTPHKPAAQDTALWMSGALRPEAQNGLELDASKIVGVVNQADDKRAGLTVDKLINKWLTSVNFAAQIPKSSTTLADINQDKWQCPPEALAQVRLLAQRVCGVSPAAPAATQTSAGSLLQRFKKKK